MATRFIGTPYGAEITQRRLRIDSDHDELLRVQGAVAVLQQLQQGAAAASDRGRD